MAEVRRESLFSGRPAVFIGLSDSDCTRIRSRATPREYLCHDVIFWAGDPVKEVLLLTKGRVKIAQFTADGLEVIFRLNIPGDIIGVPTQEPGGEHRSTAQVVQPCSVLAWDAATFNEVLLEFPIFRRNIEFIVAQFIDELQKRFCEVVAARVAPRLARTLLRLMDQMCQRVEGPIELDVAQEVLGQMTAITTPTISRVLGKWEDQGIVNVRRGSLVIRDIPKLQLLCQTANGAPKVSGLHPRTPAANE